MTNPSDPSEYPAPDPERIRRALDAMHARRSRLRRLRIAAVSSGLVVVAAVAILAVRIPPSGSPQLRVEGPAATTTTSSPTTSTSSTSTSTTSTSTTPTTARQGSREISYQPFSAAGAIDARLHVTANVTGTCVSGESERTYRCFDSSGGAIHDPCFVGPRGGAQPLVCPRDPVSGDVVVFMATSVAPPATATANPPWAMQLSGGQVCLFVSAAWGGLGPYDCQRNNASVTPADCRQPQPAQPWWTTECQDEKTDASPFRADTVTTIWF